MKIRQNKMMSYLAVTAGVGCASSAANAAVVFYGNAGNNNLQADPNGVNLGKAGQSQSDRFVDSNGSIASFFASGDSGVIFSRGGDIIPASGKANTTGLYTTYDGFVNGAASGSANYANISFDFNGNVYEAVAQFYFDRSGGGYLMAIATTNPIPNPQNLFAVGGPALSISAGKAMIDAAAVPEPTSLGLLSLGAMGLATRRQRRKAA